MFLEEMEFAASSETATVAVQQFVLINDQM